MFEWLTLERLGWTFVVLCALGLTVNAAALLRPQWRSWTTLVDFALNLALMALGVLLIVGVSRRSFG